MSVISSSFLALYVLSFVAIEWFCMCDYYHMHSSMQYICLCMYSRYYLYFSLSVVKHFEDALDSVPGTSKENGRSPNIERRPQPIANPDAFQFLFPVLGKCWERSILD